MYDVWLQYGEFLVMGGVGLMLALLRRAIFGKLCRDAALGSGGKGKMLRAMTLKFEKSYEVNVGIHDMQVFVQKYLCQERRLGIRLGRWRRLPERWLGLILGAGFLEAMAFGYLGRPSSLCLNRFLAAAAAAVALWTVILIFESDSLWEQARVCLLDYVSNTLYPRQIHVYEGFEEEKSQAQATEEQKQIRAAGTEGEKKQDGNFAAPKARKGIVLEKDEEQIFQEVLSDFLGSST